MKWLALFFIVVAGLVVWVNEVRAGYMVGPSTRDRIGAVVLLCLGALLALIAWSIPARIIAFLVSLGFIMSGVYCMVGNWGNDCGPMGRRKLSLWQRMLPYGLLLFGILFAGFFPRLLHAQDVRVPDVDARLRLLVEQAASDEWGVDASPALLAAQLHQESSWNPSARSSVGAEGLAQIMPTTGKWLAQQFPQIGAYDPWDAAWSARAAAVYDHWLYVRNPGSGMCSSWAFAFSAYNGGETLLHREQSLAKQHGKDGMRWFGNTANYSARSSASWQQNRDYVHRILIVLEPAYIHAGWSGTAVCV